MSDPTEINVPVATQPTPDQNDQNATPSPAPPETYFVSVCAKPQSGPSFSFSLRSDQKFGEPIAEWFAKNSALDPEIHLKGLTITYGGGTIPPETTPQTAGITASTISIDVTW